MPKDPRELPLLLRRPAGDQGRPFLNWLPSRSSTDWDEVKEVGADGARLRLPLVQSQFFAQAAKETGNPVKVMDISELIMAFGKRIRRKAWAISKETYKALEAIVGSQFISDDPAICEGIGPDPVDTSPASDMSG